MPKETIRLSGSSHSTPRAHLKILGDLLRLEGVEEISWGRFWEKGQRKRFEGIDEKWYDPGTKKLKILVRGFGWYQEVFLRVEEDNYLIVQSYLEKYNG